MKKTTLLKLTICLSILLSYAATAMGGFSVFFLNDEQFSRIDEVSDQHGGIVYKDELGRQLGSSSKESNGGYSYRDKLGLLIGSSSTDSHGKTLYKDKLGNQIGSSEVQSDGSTVYKDNTGDVVAEASAN